MAHWTRYFEILDPLPSLARPLQVAVQEETDPAYQSHGRLRGNQRMAVYIYTLSGTGGFRDGAGEHRARPCEGILCKVFDPATSYFYPADGTEPWVFLWITFDGGAAFDVVDDLTARFGPILALPREEGVAPRLLALRHRPQPVLETSAFAGHRLVTDLLVELGERARWRQEADGGVDLVRRVQEDVRNRMHEPLAVAEIADRLGVTREHLSRVFRQSTGDTLQEYVRRQKVLLAARLLQGTSLSSKEVAARLGFGAPAGFSRAFRREMGVSPREYRRLSPSPTP